jgi:hypothetical protein
MGSIIRSVANDERVPIMYRSGLDLVSASDMPVILAALGRKGLRVLGIEGFALDGAAIIPDMMAIADFSSPRSADQSVADAHSFIASLGSEELWYSVTVSEA